MKKTVLLIITLDTKGPEALFLRGVLERLGVHVLLMDVGIFPSPGHSVGHQSVAVRTAMGTIVIAGDAVFVEENMQGDPAHLLDFIPIGRYVNYFDMWNSFKEIRNRADIVLPGHECKVFHRQSYP